MAVSYTNRYSEAFKIQVIQEIESGKMRIGQARKRYGLGGDGTIRGWLNKYGKQHLLGKVVRVETPDERDRLKAIEKDKKQLESALAQTQLKVMALEELIRVAEEEYKIDIKKNSGPG